MALWFWDERVQPIVYNGMLMHVYATPAMRPGIAKVIAWLVNR